MWPAAATCRCHLAATVAVSIRRSLHAMRLMAGPAGPAVRIRARGPEC